MTDTTRVESPPTITTGRVEAFSDGVFAIAITLLIIEIRPPQPSDHLGHELLLLWPSYLGYTVSFLIIGVVWLNHHLMFRHIVRADRILLVLNLLLLMNVAFLPFPTAVLADALARGASERVAVMLYGGTLVVGGVLFNAVWLYAARGHRLLGGHLTPAQARRITLSFLPGPAAYGLAAIVGLALPAAGLVLYVVLLLAYLMEVPLRAKT
jgi:uncharacterized membrane protein